MFCLVAEHNGKLGPLGVFKAKYDCVRWGLNAMGGLIDPKYDDHKYNGITEFQIWTDEIEIVNIADAMHYYRMGLADAKSNNVKANKIVGLAHNSSLYKIYEQAVKDVRRSYGERL